MEHRDSRGATHIEDSTVEHVSSIQHADTVSLDVQSVSTMTGEFPNLSSLIAPKLRSLESGQVPKLSTLNASEIDIKLADFPQLREVYIPIKGWKKIREEMRLNGWRYQNGLLVQPIAEKRKATAAAKAGKGRGSHISALTEIYGEGIRDLIRDIEEHNPEITPEQMVREIEVGGTCENSSFFRESNISALVELMSQDKNKHWEILSAGCANGPEPHQLGIQLQDAGLDFHIDGVDANPESIRQAQSGKGEFDKFSTKDDFFRKMAAKGILSLKDDAGEYQLSSALKEKLSFKRHDLIDSKAEAAKEYDIVICNNVLQHFPEHTRELILVNILENLQDRGTLALETDHLFFNSEEEEKWLAPYYKWKKHLKKFGLKQATIKNSRTLWGSNVVFRYEKNRNKFKDGTYRIRNEKLEKKR